MTEYDDDSETEKDIFEEYLKGVRAKNGIDWNLEDQANRILADGRRGTTKHSEMTDYLSPSQLARRMNREVYPASGIPDPHLVSGLFKRSYIPERKAGPRDGRLEIEETFPVEVRDLDV